MNKSQFKPTKMTVPVGRAVKVIVKNSDLVGHTFTVKKLGIEVGVAPGSERLITP